MGEARSGELTYGAAFPSIRPLLLARALGARAQVGSICEDARTLSLHRSSSGFEQTMTATVKRIGAGLRPVNR
jgi:hypothetical protein